MRTLIFTGIIAILVFGIYSFKKLKSEEVSTNKGIEFFEGNFHQALLKSQELNKPVFLDIYATWCGPCKKLKKITFKDEEVGNYFNANFINIAIDGETQEGYELISKYNIRSYPSLLILDSKGEVKTRTIGYQEPHILINFGKRIVP
jgi:thioredoxin 1